MLELKSTIKFAVKASVPIEGTFEKWDATFTVTSTAAESGVLDVKIQAASVNTGSGMKDRKLKSKDFSNADQDPLITFHSSKIVQTGPNTFDIQGTFTIRGVSKPERLHLTLSGRGTGSGEVTGTMAFRHGMNSGIPFIKSFDISHCQPVQPRHQFVFNLSLGVGTLAPIPQTVADKLLATQYSDDTSKEVRVGIRL